MQSQLYVSISAQLALQRRIDTIANNIANISTAGFRADEISFEQLTANSAGEPTSFVSRGDTHISLRQGELSRTGNPLDVAIRGSGWLSVQTGDKIAYTRDGRLKISEEGILSTIAGNSVLDPSGSPIQLDLTAGAPQIAADGTITQGSRRAGSIGLFSMPGDSKLRRGEGASVVPDTAPSPELDFNRNGILQGYVEKSNVNSVSEMTRLIAVQRAFEAVSSVIQESETALQDAARALSGT